MIIAIITFIGVLIGVIYGIYEGWDFWGKVGSSLFFSFLIGMIGLSLGVGVGLIGGLCCDTTTGPITVQETTQLIAMKDNIGIEGYHFLTSGYVEDELKYYYIYEDGQRGMTTGNVKADRAYIKYIAEGKTPYMEKWEQTTANKVADWLFMPDETYYTFYLPEGSVIENYYSVDLE